MEPVVSLKLSFAWVTTMKKWVMSLKLFSCNNENKKTIPLPQESDHSYRNINSHLFSVTE